MKITKEGNKVIIELEQVDAGPMPIEEAVDAWYSGFKMMIENPDLVNKLAANTQSILPEEMKAGGVDLLQKHKLKK